ncbi:MAG: hypothetical protein IIB59_02485 [Planctomycetes bacterium]|nr:hypothetical protein [Planctomycetota bacterium]
MQGRWKNVALTVYLICPLALVTGLCVWIMLSLQQRVENAGKMREVPEQQDIAPESPSTESVQDARKNEEGVEGVEGEVGVEGGGAPGNSEEQRSESGG